VTVATWLVCSTGVSDSRALAQLFDEHYELLLRSSSELATEVRRRDYDDELGVNDDPANRFGALHSERFQTRQLVADTGLHSKRWTHDKAIEYLGNESEVDRYMA